MRYIIKEEIHKQAVVIGRSSKNKMTKTANRLAACNVDKQIDCILSQLKPSAWELNDEVIIKGCAQKLWIQFCQAEINLQKQILTADDLREIIQTSKTNTVVIRMESRIQAPKGGCFCLDNKEWYEGGQFLPSTDLPKGIMKKVKKVASIKGNISKIEVKKSFSGYAVFVSYTSGLSNQLVFNCLESEEANLFAKAILEEKKSEYECLGLVAHTTNLILI